MADRYAGDFARRSELLQGFLLDPLVFGSSARYQPVVNSAMHHARATAQVSRSGESAVTEGIVSANGVFAKPRVSYFAEWIDTDIEPRRAVIAGRARTGTAALGWKPGWNSGAFLFLNRLTLDVDLGAPRVDGEYQHAEGTDDRADVGGYVGFDSKTQLWVKVGVGRQTSGLDTVSQTSSAIIPGLISVRETNFRMNKSTRDVALRFISTGEGRAMWGVGAEWGRVDRPQRLAQDLFVRPPGGSVPRRFLDTADDARSDTVQANMTREWGAWQIDAALGHTRFRQPRTFVVSVPAPLGFLSTVPDPLRANATTGGVGVVATLGDTEARSVARATCGQWLRPAMSSTLQAVAIAGIAFDDQLVNVGGTARRCALRAEHTFGTRAFLAASWEAQSIDNLFSVLEGVVNTESDLANPERLRSRVLPQAPRFEQLEERPVFSEAKLQRMTISAEAFLHDRVSVRGHYAHTRSENRLSVFKGRLVPWVPRHQVNLALTWLRPGSGLVSVGPVYRSVRYRDEANQLAVPAGWDIQARVFHEWGEKRWSVEFFVQNAAKKAASTISGANLSVRF
jgi:hypothetical protein